MLFCCFKFNGLNLIQFIHSWKRKQFKYSIFNKSSPKSNIAIIKFDFYRFLLHWVSSERVSQCRFRLWNLEMRKKIPMIFFFPFWLSNLWKLIDWKSGRRWTCSKHQTHLCLKFTTWRHEISSTLECFLNRVHERHGSNNTVALHPILQCFFFCVYHLKKIPDTANVSDFMRLWIEAEESSSILFIASGWLRMDLNVTVKKP